MDVQARLASMSQAELEELNENDDEINKLVLELPQIKDIQSQRDAGSFNIKLHISMLNDIFMAFYVNMLVKYIFIK